MWKEEGATQDILDSNGDAKLWGGEYMTAVLVLSRSVWALQSLPSSNKLQLCHLLPWRQHLSWKPWRARSGIGLLSRAGGGS